MPGGSSRTEPEKVAVDPQGLYTPWKQHGAMDGTPCWIIRMGLFSIYLGSFSHMMFCKRCAVCGLSLGFCSPVGTPRILKLEGVLKSGVSVRTTDNVYMSDMFGYAPFSRVL